MIEPPGEASITRFAVFAPAETGLNVAVTVHVPIDCSVEQPFWVMNSAASAPVMMTASEPLAPRPRFVITIEVAGDMVETTTLPNSTFW